MRIYRLLAGTASAAAVFPGFSYFRASGAGEIPAVGAGAPDFTLQSQEGKPVSLHDFRGQWVALYFYPKDFTSGCTIEARNFQRDIAQYQRRHGRFAPAVLYERQYDFPAARASGQEGGRALRFDAEFGADQDGGTPYVSDRPGRCHPRDLSKGKSDSAQCGTSRGPNGLQKGD
jgi:hypothetical protein